MSNARRVHTWSVVLFAALTLTVIVAGGSIERRVELDKRSGRMRYRWLMLGCGLSESQIDTRFSRMAAPFVDASSPTDWKTVETWSALQPRSPYYWFHTVPYTLEEFAYACEMGWVDEQERARIVPEILICLENEDMGALNTVVSEAARRGQAEGERKR